MASIELCPLSAHLEESEVHSLEGALSESGASPLDIDEDAETVLLERDVDDDMLADLVDRLEVSDAAADVYVPPDFEETYEIGGWKIGSAHALLLALQDLAEELGVDEGDDDPDFEDDLEDEDESYTEELLEDDEGYDLKDEQMRHICKLLQQGAKLCIRRGVAMFVHGD